MGTARTSSARRRNRTRARKNSGPRVPSFRHHKATGQGYVVLNGQAIYLGRHDDPAAEQKCHQVIAEWLLTHRVHIVEANGDSCRLRDSQRRMRRRQQAAKQA